MNSNLFLLDRLLLPLHTMDLHRPNTLLQEAETAAQQDSYTAGAVGGHQAGPLLPFHGRAPHGTSRVTSPARRRRLPPPTPSPARRPALTRAPQIWLFHPVAEFLGMSTWQVPFPPWQHQAAQIAFFFVFEDMFHFFGSLCLFVLIWIYKLTCNPNHSSPCSSLGPSLQAHPQDSSQVLCSLRSCCRIRPSR